MADSHRSNLDPSFTLAVTLLPQFEIVRRVDGEGIEPHLSIWVQHLPTLIEELILRWDFEVRGPLNGGMSSIVFEGRRRSTGEKAVLRLSPPNQKNAAALRALLAVQGAAVPVVFEADVERGAVLMERLGKPLYQSSLSTEEQLRQCVSSLVLYWKTKVGSMEVEMASHWALECAAKHREWWIQTCRPCTESLLMQAQDTLRAILSTSSTSRTVLLMGDPHPANLLAAAHGGGWKWIDIGALYGPPEFDLGKMLASWHDVVNAARHPGLVLLRHCAIIAAAAGADPSGIWRWGLFHRVTTGLWLCMSGQKGWGEAVLAATEAMARESVPTVS